MKRNQSFVSPMQAGASPLSVPCGLFHLVYHSAWRCAFVSDTCLTLFNCTQDDFLDVIQSDALFLNEKEEVTVRTLLHNLSEKPEQQECILIRQNEEHHKQHIRVALTSIRDTENIMHLYGQVIDLTQSYRAHSLSNAAMCELQSGLEQSGKTIYHYVVDKRRAVLLSSALSKQLAIPEINENFPDWMVDSGYISPESVNDWLELFYAIERGEKYGLQKIKLVLPDGNVSRYSLVKFIGFSDEEGRPASALIIHENATEENEHNRNRELERAGLLQVAQMSFPEILSINLTKGTYHILQYYGATTLGTPSEGSLLDMLNLRLPNVAKEEQQAFQDTFFPENLIKAISEGKSRVQLAYRRIGQDGVWHWTETTVIRQNNPYDSDILFMGVSRSIDQHKAQEEALKQALTTSANQLDGWLYYNSLSNQNFPGLVYINFDDNRASPYTVGTLAKRLNCSPHELALATCFRIPQEDRGLLERARQEAKQHNETSFRVEYRIQTKDGEIAWVNNHAVRFTDRDGSTGHIYFLTDNTHEHLLMEQLRSHMEDQMEKEREMFQIVAQHSNRSLYIYDLASGTTHPWDTDNNCEDILSHLYSDKYEEGALDSNAGIVEESVQEVQKFFSDIHAGVPSGVLKIHLRLTDGQTRWYHFYFSNIFSNGSPVTALISVEDITDRHEQEIVYQRHVQEVIENKENSFLYMESCLVCDRVEVISSLFLPADNFTENCPHSQFGPRYLEPYFQFEEAEEAKHFFSIEHLLDAFTRGERKLERIWKIFFNDGSHRWIETEVKFLEDPYDGHVKSFIRMMDITEKHEEHLSVVQLANHDTMTGLLRKAFGEARIREYLETNHTTGGVLLALDLDDLKGINDTLGHAAGDSAIMGIAEALKNHFRKDDLLIRAGGDEFLIFLPGAAKAIPAIERSVASLLKKISSITIGEQNQRSIHCSIGCAVEETGADTFESLYQRADTALYYVKRSGKGSFVFYEPAMLEADYQFRINHTEPNLSEKTEIDPLRELLMAVAVHYPDIVFFNLTKNQFQALSTGADTKDTTQIEDAKEFWNNWKKRVHPEDWEETVTTLSSTNLMRLYAQGVRDLEHRYRNRENGEFTKTRVKIQLYSTEKAEICAFLFFRREP